jgi:hypothetical protein
MEKNLEMTGSFWAPQNHYSDTSLHKMLGYADYPIYNNLPFLVIGVKLQGLFLLL